MCKVSKSLQKGFTIIELIVSMVVFSTLLGFITINLLNTKHHASLDASLDSLISDVRQQQIKAMVGDTEGRAANDNYGIYFGTTFYTLFHGSAYSSSDTTNFIVNLPDRLQFSGVTLSSSTLLFTKGTGAISGFDPTKNTFVLVDTTGNIQKTITFNTYGVITNIQ